jgi:predicted nucleic acid-binding protein
MNLALDTNRYADFCWHVPDPEQRVQRAHRVLLPFAVIAELSFGFLRGTRAKENEQILTQFLARPRVEIIYPDEQTTHHFARLTYQLRQQRTPSQSTTSGLQQSWFSTASCCVHATDISITCLRFRGFDVGSLIP